MSLASQRGVIASAVIHGALLLATLIVVTDAPKLDDPTEAAAVDVISDDQFKQIMQGDKSAQPAPKPQVQADKQADIADRKPPAKVEAKVDAPTPPPPLKRIPDPGEDDTPDPPTPPKRVAVVPPEPPKPTPPTPPARPADPPLQPKAQSPKPDAEAIEPPKPPPRPKEAKKPDPKPPLDAAKLAALLQDDAPRLVSRPRSGDETSQTKTAFNSDEISNLITKEQPGQRPSAARNPTRQAALGAPTATGARMSPSQSGQLDGLLQDQFKQCWNYPFSTGEERYVPQIRVDYDRGGVLTAQPALLNPSGDPKLRALADSALRAVRKCNPLRIPAQFAPYFDQWKSRILRFDPEEMAG